MDLKYRVAVTGSRGKSGVTRLIHAALCGCGVRAYARVTGVVPRMVTPDGTEMPIMRPSGADVAEMRWWLNSLPADAEGVVCENSAVAPDLQAVCPFIIKPDVTVLTNTRPDHETFWGPGENDVLEALSHALPRGSVVVMPRELTERAPVMELADRKNLRLVPADPVTSQVSYRAVNFGLALAVCRYFGLDEAVCLKAMENLPEDFADFKLLKVGEGELAFAFSANEVTSTSELFSLLGWTVEETGIIYNHRHDRVDRFRNFEKWLKENPWRRVVIIGDRLPITSLKCEYPECTDCQTLAELLKSGKWLGCGNSVYGLPLEFKLALEEGRIKL